MCTSVYKFCVCISVHMHVFLSACAKETCVSFVCMCVHLCICMGICVFVCMFICVHMSFFVCMSLCIYICVLHLCVCMYVYVYICMLVYVYQCVSVCECSTLRKWQLDFPQPFLAIRIISEAPYLPGCPVAIPDSLKVTSHEPASLASSRPPGDCQGLDTSC